MNNLKIFLIISSVIIFNSCGDFDLYPCLEGSGDFINETRAIANFNSVNNTTEFEVIVVADSTTSLIVESDANLLQYIRTYVQGQNLVIATDKERCIQSTNRTRITIRCPHLERTVLSGSGDMELYDFESEYFSATLSGSGDLDINDLIVGSDAEFNLTGSGDINVDGKANSSNYVLSGSGDIDADRFKVERCNVTLAGSGNMYVNFVSSMEGILSGSGDIHYFGNESGIRVRTTGSGKLIKE